MTEVRISRKGADRVASGHPWIFSSDVTDRGAAQPGDAVTVLDPRGRVLGTAHYSSTSQICLRMLSPRPEEIGAAWFQTKIQAAESHRRMVVSGSDAYRLVHAEADGLPGLIVDRYGDYFVVQTLDQGMDRAREWVIDALPPAAGVVLRNDAAVRARESLPLATSVVRGQIPERVVAAMNGLRLEADLVHGQKTGIYLDQRENYLAAARWARGAALDCFTSTGGFALHMAARCSRIEAVDSSGPALDTARTNAQTNQIFNVEFREANVFDVLAAFSQSRRQFETIVLDPPAFAKSRGALDGAARGYKEINVKALRLLGPGGILITCSCSHHVSEADLLQIVAEAALDARKALRVLERRTQAQDHPILLTVPETHYLKCLVLQVV